jgi:hypothetical protein
MFSETNLVNMEQKLAAIDNWQHQTLKQLDDLEESIVSMIRGKRAELRMTAGKLKEDVLGFKESDLSEVSFSYTSQEH